MQQINELRLYRKLRGTMIRSLVYVSVDLALATLFAGKILKDIESQLEQGELQEAADTTCF